MSKKSKKDKRAEKPRMTKEERRAKYTQLARNRQAKQQTRMKESKMVCFHCRQRGHSLANCPLVGKDKIKAGDQGDEANLISEKASLAVHGNSICFKCGSTEHTLKQCPHRQKKHEQKQDYGGDEENENRKDETNGIEFLPYATCFICKETGHLAGQCPSNQKGIYIHGGSCKECGSKMHRASDCPERKKRKQQNELQLTAEDEDWQCLLEGNGDDNMPESNKGEKTFNKGDSIVTRKPATVSKRRVVKF